MRFNASPFNGVALNAATAPVGTGEVQESAGGSLPIRRARGTALFEVSSREEAKPAVRDVAEAAREAVGRRRSSSHASLPGLRPVQFQPALPAVLGAPSYPAFGGESLLLASLRVNILLLDLEAAARRMRMAVTAAEEEEQAVALLFLLTD